MADARIVVDDDEEEVVVICVPMRVVELRYTTDSGWPRRLLVDSWTCIVPPYGESSPAPWSTRDGKPQGVWTYVSQPLDGGNILLQF